MPMKLTKMHRNAFKNDVFRDTFWGTFFLYIFFLVLKYRDHVAKNILRPRRGENPSDENTHFIPYVYGEYHIFLDVSVELTIFYPPVQFFIPPPLYIRSGKILPRRAENFGDFDHVTIFYPPLVYPLGDYKGGIKNC